MIILGGSIAKTYVDDISYYFNIIAGKIIDLTKDQFFKKIDYTIYKVVNRQDLLNDDTKKRYKDLKEKIEKYL